MSSERKFLLELVYKIYFNQHETTQDTFIRSILNAYIIEKTKDKTDTFKMLTVDNETVPDKKTKITSALKKIFIQSDKTKLSKITKLLFDIFITKFSITVEEAFRLFIDFMKANSINSIFKKCRGSDLSLILIDFNADTVKPKKSRAAKHLFSESKKALFKLEIKPSNTKSTREEIVRMMQALYLVRNSKKRLKESLCDLSYYFYHVRSELWIKNRLSFFNSKKLKLIDTEESFHELIYDIKNFSPEHVIRSDVKNYLNQHITLNLDEMQLYLNVFEEDKQRWLNSDNAAILQQASPYDIFYGALQKTFSCDKPAFRERIRRWSDTYSTRYPCYPSISPVSIPEVINYPEPEFGFDNNDVKLDNNDIKLDNNDVRLDNNNVPEITPDNNIILEIKLDNNNIGGSLTDAKLDNNIPVIEDDGLCVVSSSNFNNAPDIIDNSNLILEPEIIPNNNVIFAEYERSLFSKYRYCLFNSSSARNSIFNRNNKPDKDLWNQFIDSLLQSEAISLVETSSTSFYKFNLLRCKGNGYLVNTHVIKFLTRNFGPQKNFPIFTACSSRTKLDHTVRPKLDDWKKYLDDLVKDDVLILHERTFNGVNHFKLRN